MAVLGLLCIILGWALQFVSLLQDDTQISWVFVASYSVGVFLLVTDGYVNGGMEIANLNLLALILSLCVLLTLMTKKRITASSKTFSKKRK
jgi:hypothetical protein